ncbi:elongation factor 1-beta [Candidatus Woesearchaeota archaeon]|nr:elongation factor 1-beta [Candidatus Woesearchaeota archaeon]|tara:strand:- start:3973 stop:4248 length:276 start_codon:yes stop_codon:yes gene_type:complete
MTNVIVTMKIMPSSPDSDLKAIEEEAKKEISEFGGEVGKTEQEPIAFGLKALMLYFVMDESLGSTEDLEEKVKKIKDVNSVEVPDVRRAIG